MAVSRRLKKSREKSAQKQTIDGNVVLSSPAAVVIAEDIPVVASPENESGARRTWRNLLTCTWLDFLPLMILPAIIYANTLQGPFIFDDQPNILNNQAIRISSLSLNELRGVVLDSFYPARWFTNLSFALNYYFHGYSLAGYHLVNIILHISNGILLYLFTRETLVLAGLSRMGQRSWLPLTAALLWVVHPLDTQAVTYVVQRMTSIAALFYLVAMLCYVKARRSGPTNLRYLLAAGGLLSFIFGLGCKEIVVTLPLMIFFYEWYFFQNLRGAWIRRVSPVLLGLALLFLGLGFFYLGSSPLETIMAGYNGRDFSLGQRLLTELRVVVFYLSLFIYPHPSRLCLDHEFSVSISLLEPFTTLLSGLFICLLLAMLILTARRHRLFSFGLLWFLVNLILESSVIGLEIIFEHRTYLPTMMLIPAIMAVGASRFTGVKFRAPVVIILVVMLSFWSHERNKVWAGPLPLWQDCVEKASGNWRSRYNLGKALLDDWQQEAAIGHLNETVELVNQTNISSIYRSMIHFNLGLAYARSQRVNDAKYQFEAVLRYNPADTRARKILQDIRSSLKREGFKHPGLHPSRKSP